MNELRNLPQSGPWEVELVDMPGMEIQGAVLAGILLVAESDTGLVRHVQPLLQGQDPSEALILAASAPAPPNTAGRPAALLCRGPLAPGLRAAAAAFGAKLSVKRSLPQADVAATGLLISMAGGLPTDPAPWEPLIQALISMTPWKFLPDSVQFRFLGGPAALRDGVGLVIGLAGAQRGFVFYPTQGDYQAFCAMVEAGGPVRGMRFTCWCVHLDPLEEFPERICGLLDSAGLSRDGLGLRLFAMDGFESRSLSREEEASFRAALAGTLASWREHGGGLKSGPQVARTQTELGELTVFTVPGNMVSFEDDSLLLPVEHQIALMHGLLNGAVQPFLVLKMAKKHAVRLSEMAEGLDGISLEEGRNGLIEVIAWAGEDQLGVLTEVASDPAAWARWRAEGQGSVVFSAGGAKRKAIREQDFVGVFPVDFLLSEDE